MKKQQIVLITGATSGIGRHAALHLARAGHRVIATGRRPKALAELAACANDEGLKIASLVLDVTDDDSIASARAEVDRLTDGYGLDVLVNNAGYGHAGPTSEISDAELRSQYDTNVFGLMAVTRAFLPQMRDRRSGKILNISSVGGLMTLPMYGVYNSTKYAVESMSDALRIEMRPFGVSVVLIEPGIIRTNFTPRSLESVDRYGRAGEPYANAMGRFDNLAARSDKMAVSPISVSRAIARAIRRRRPAARYIAPFRTKIMLGFYRVMPTRWMDWMFRRVYGLTPKRLLATPATPQALLTSDNS